MDKDLHPKIPKNSKPTKVKAPKGMKMTLAKARAVGIENRIRQAATWELTEGNRKMTEPTAVFERASELRRMLDMGEFVDISALETWVFERWLPGRKQTTLNFMDTDPVGGG